MGLIDAFIPKEQAAKAADALKTAEVERKNKIRQTLAQAGVSNESLVESLFVASSQAPSLRVAATASGKGALAEILTKVADKLEGR
jgi:hypothetical protein